jgi:hypothetical protein
MAIVVSVLYGVTGGFGGVLAAGGSGPLDLAAGQLLGFPLRVLFEAMVVPALGPFTANIRTQIW